MRMIFATALIPLTLLIAEPAVAQERWTHAASGASFPERFEAQSLGERRDLGTPNDSVVNYNAATGIESTTIYIFKASVPNARLWFDRAMPVVANQIPMELFEAGPVEKVSAFGSSSPNAIRQIFVAREPGPFKSTALVVAQSGPWIVKVRATSATLTRPELAARIDRHLAMIQTAPPAFAASLDAPKPCLIARQFGAGKPISGSLEEAAAAAILIHARVHAPTAQWCLADEPNSRFTLLGVVEQPSSWLLLMADAGKAIGSETIATSQADTRHLVYVSTPAATSGAAVFDAAMTLQEAGRVATPLLRDPAAALFVISTPAADPLVPKTN